jgi:hypothetical protein
MNMKPIALFIIAALSLHSLNTFAQQVDYNKVSKELTKPTATAANNIDTTINLSLFDLSKVATTISTKEKKKLVMQAVNTAMGETSYLFLDNACMRLDPKDGPVSTGKKGIDCRLNDFYLIDLDADGDLDIIYSSLVDQYLNWDNNSLLIFKNNKENFSLYSIPGYLYEADLSTLNHGSIILKTVSRPCCDYGYFNFHSTTFDTKKWTYELKKVLEIHKSKVKETY